MKKHHSLYIWAFCVTFFGFAMLGTSIPIGIIAVIIGAILFYKAYSEATAYKQAREMIVNMAIVQIKRMCNCYMVNLSDGTISEIANSDNPVKRFFDYVPKYESVPDFRAKLLRRTLFLLKTEMGLGESDLTLAMAIVQNEIYRVEFCDMENIMAIQNSMLPYEVPYAKDKPNFDSIAMNFLMDVADSFESEYLQDKVYQIMADHGYSAKPTKPKVYIDRKRVNPDQSDDDLPF